MPGCWSRPAPPSPWCRAPTTNIKLTLPEDFARLEAPLSRLTPARRHGLRRAPAEVGRPKLICAASTVPTNQGLDGHSDADVGIHALCDAIYGALAEGDIGRHFPPTDVDLEGCRQRALPGHAAGRIAARGGVLANADVTLICERPKITPHRRP